MAFSLDQFYRLNRRALIWIILLGLLYLLRDFFGLIFLTFVLAFFAAPLAAFGQRYLRMTRRISIIVVYGLFLMGIVLFATFVTPRVLGEADVLRGNLGQIEAKLLDLKKNLVAQYPSLDPLIMGYLRAGLPRASVKEGRMAADTAVPGSDAGPLDDEQLIRIYMNQQAGQLREHLPTLARMLWQGSVTMMLALLFSFLISLDTIRLGQEVQSLRASRLRDFYEQTAQPVVRFAYVVGRALQAQAVIAIVNTALTLAGLLVLGIPSIAMLALIVFICSFIPVLGVFISTLPILLVALNAGGLGKAVAVVVLVILVHLIEAYLLNPLIYGKHLKLNPVVVLMILFVGHHAFGVWGMLLGVPVAYYFIHDVFGVPVWDENRLSADKRPAEEEPAARPKALRK
ncbi:MAG: AI-2E family transporter [bacterium]|nr:AI-2E family transporter [bacterium]